MTFLPIAMDSIGGNDDLSSVYSEDVVTEVLDLLMHGIDNSQSN